MFDDRKYCVEYAAILSRPTLRKLLRHADYAQAICCRYEWVSPVATGETDYVTRNVLVKAGDAYQPAQYFRHLVALDASTGQERWRYPASPAGTIGLCIEEAVVAGGTYFGVSGVTLHAVNLATGRNSGRRSRYVPA